jgi:hypothetical protein
MYILYRKLSFKLSGAHYATKTPVMQRGLRTEFSTELTELKFKSIASYILVILLMLKREKILIARG